MPPAVLTPDVWVPVIVAVIELGGGILGIVVS